VSDVRVRSDAVATETGASLFGQLVGASELELALVEQLRMWLPDYLGEVCSQRGEPVDFLPYPRSFLVSGDVDKMPEDQTPACIVRSPGTSGELPVAVGNGAYTAQWTIEVAMHLSARGNMLALRLARMYALAMRALLLQQQLLDEHDSSVVVRRVDWIGERYDELDSIDDRTVCTGVVVFAYELADVTTRGAGPLEPSSPIPPDSPVWPTSEHVISDITKEPIP
jgi:hypothetical protein